MASFINSDNCEFQLLASRVKGTIRQLWIDKENNIENILDDEFKIRHIDTRKKFDLANKIGDILFFSNISNNIDRINMNDCTINEFNESYIIPQKPVIILDCTKNSLWPAGSEYWKPDSLLNSLGINRRFEVKDANATVSLDDFIKYIRSINCFEDDNPAYLWETLIDGEHDDIISKFQIPKYFTENGKGGIHTPGDGADLLSDAGVDGSLFGLHRWLLMGPVRSGSNLHIDPLHTSAWNTLLLGSKYWVVFPPGIPEEYLINATKSVNLLSDDNEIYSSDYCSASWFLLVLPFIESEVLNGNWPEEFQPQKFIQYEGETIYIPAGWWHAVLNIDLTVCVTQNIAEVLLWIV
jgi:histone arginine demethylase JMJD6